MTEIVSLIIIIIGLILLRRFERDKRICIIDVIICKIEQYFVSQYRLLSGIVTINFKKFWDKIKWKLK